MYFYNYLSLSKKITELTITYYLVEMVNYCKLYKKGKTLNLLLLCIV